MNTIQLHDKKFVPYLSEGELMAHIDAIAEQINAAYAGRTPLLLAVLNGAFMFAADLMKRLTIPCEISFVKLASYEGTTSTGKVREVLGINEDLSGRDIIVVEDIVESGLTMAQMRESLGARGIRSFAVCTLFAKPNRLVVRDLNLDYVAMTIGDEFIVGYGLDYNQQGRNLREVYKVSPSE